MVNNIEFKINLLLTMYNLRLMQGMRSLDVLVLAGTSLKFSSVTQDVTLS
jgi:hypothetical protein